MKYTYLFILALVLLVSCGQKKQAEIPIYQKELSDTMITVLDNARSLRKTDLPASLEMVKSAIKLGHDINDDAGLIRAYRNAVFVAGALMYNPDAALEISDKAVTLGKRLNDANTYCDIYGMRAMVFQVAGNNDSATYYNKLAIEYMDRDKAPDSLKNWPLYLNSADHYYKLGNYRLAIDYTKKYLHEWAEVKNDSNAIRSSYGNLANYYIMCKDTAKSIENTQKAWQYKSPGDRDFELNTIMHSMYMNRNMPDSAYFFAKDNVLLTTDSGDSLRYIVAVSDLAETIATMNSVTLARSFLSQTNINKALEIYKKQTENIPLIVRRDFALHISKNYKLTHENVSALNFMTDAMNHQIKLNEEQNSRKMEEFELERHRIQAENSNLANQVKMESQRNTIMLLIFSVLALVGILSVLFITYRSKIAIHKKTLENLKDNEVWKNERLKLEGQLEERSRIARELHDDLGASLTSLVLSSSMLKPQSTDLEEGLAQIKKTAKNTIISLNEVVWTLNSKNDSLHSLSAYIRKFANSFLSESSISIDFHDSTEDCVVVGEKRRAIYLTIKEGLHNIVKHSTASSVKMVLSKTQDMLQINLSDDGRGFSYPDVQESGNGLGNMRKNIESFGGRINWRNEKGTEILITCRL